MITTIGYIWLRYFNGFYFEIAYKYEILYREVYDPELRA